MRHTRQHRGLAVTALSLLASCVSPDVAPTESRVIGLEAWAAKGGPPPRDSVRLVVTVSDDPAFQVGSDGFHEYIDGASGMRAIIDQFGNLQITPTNANNSTPPQRRLDVRYPPERTDLVHTFPDQWNFKILSNRVNNENPRIQDMTVSASLCYNVTIAHRTQQVSYANAFNVALDAGGELRTDHANQPNYLDRDIGRNGVDGPRLRCGKRLLHDGF